MYPLPAVPSVPCTLPVASFLCKGLARQGMWRAPIMCLSVNVVAAFTWWLCFEVDAYAFCPTTGKAETRAGRYTSCTSSSLHRRREEYVAPLDMSSEEEQERASENKYLSVTKLSREQVLFGGLAAFFGSAYLGASQDQTSYRARKRNLFRSIAGGGENEFRDILEVGVGGNPKVGGFNNLEFYRRGQRIIGVDPALSGEPSQALERATEKAQKLGLTLRGVGGIAEELPFETGSFDVVVSTLVFCSVRDPAAALREVSRVLRPGGKFLFVEHVHAPDEGLSILGLRQQQELLDPLQQLLADGCHLTRETGQLIRDSAGESPLRNRLFSRIEIIESVRIKSMWPVSEQVFGVVVK